MLPHELGCSVIGGASWSLYTAKVRPYLMKRNVKRHDYAYVLI